VLEIGQFSGVEVEALRFAFRAYCPGTLLAGVEIEYLSPPLVLYCLDCENEYLGSFEDTACPVCLQSSFEIVQGRELVVKSIEGT
jgi:hydrogenase nickel incorporation protein HypA/HybF